MAKQTKDTRNTDVLQQRVEWLEKENKHLKQFNGFIEEHHINTLNKKVRDLYHRLRHSKLVYKRTVPTLQKQHHEVIKMNINLSNSFSKQMTEIDFYQNELSVYKNKIDNQLLDLKTKDLIIQDLKDVIVDYKQKYQKSELVNCFTFNNEQSNFITELELENNKLKKQLRLLNQDTIDLQICRDAIKNKNEIINKSKAEIIELNSKLEFINKSFKDTVKVHNKKIATNNEKQFKLINDLNICQSANKRQSEIIKELQLENSEVNKLLSTYKFSFYLIASIVTVVSIVGSIITLIK